MLRLRKSSSDVTALWLAIRGEGASLPQAALRIPPSCSILQEDFPVSWNRRVETAETLATSARATMIFIFIVIFFGGARTTRWIQQKERGNTSDKRAQYIRTHKGRCGGQACKQHIGACGITAEHLPNNERTENQLHERENRRMLKKITDLD
jgi:hypothetical protein